MKYTLLFTMAFVLACSPKISNTSASGKSSGSTGATSSLKVLSYNIHHCNPPSAGALIDVDTIAGVIRKLQPDLVALQEVDVRTKRSGGIDQAALLGEKTGMKHYFFKAIDHDGGEYGLAILSRLEIVSFSQHKLPTIPETKGEPRILALVTVKSSSGKEFIFACTHLDAQKDPQNRLLQIREISAITGKINLPIIIGGDFNAATGTEVINLLDKDFTRTCAECAFTIPVVNPNKTIDFIGFRPTGFATVTKHEVIKETFASDHLPVYVEFSLK